MSNRPSRAVGSTLRSPGAELCPLLPREQAARRCLSSHRFFSRFASLTPLDLERAHTGNLYALASFVLLPPHLLRPSQAMDGGASRKRQRQESGNEESAGESGSASTYEQEVADGLRKEGCVICGQDTNHETMLLCEGPGCGREYHQGERRLWHGSQPAIVTSPPFRASHVSFRLREQSILPRSLSESSVLFSFLGHNIPLSRLIHETSTHRPNELTPSGAQVA